MAKDYSQLSKEELLSIVERLESRKKYGLIWDEEKVKEQFEKDSENALPILKEITSKEIKDKDKSKPFNIFIEGDNYHTLSVLNFTHQEKIDVIYIDPPYNTGSKDFIYNDSYVLSEDAYRHSKWLSFMSKRLHLAKSLLSETGVIFISISDIEQAQLKLLCNEVFGENNFVGQLIWRKKEGGGQSDAYFVTEHEYILVYAKSATRFKWLDEEIPESEADFNKSDEDGKFNAVKLAKWGNTARREDRPKMYFPIKSPDGKNIYPIAPDGGDGRWRVGKKRMDMLIENKLVLWQQKDGKWVPYEKIYFDDENIKKIKERSILYDIATTANGTNELTTIFGKKDIFENPKPTELIKFFIKYGAKEDATILDFFAGSGTTGHAVLDLNKQDGGNRSFILCTNNEVNIASNICYPRIKKVIKDSFGSSLKYFKTAFIKNSLTKDDMKIRLSKECTEMLCLREGVFDEIKSTADYKVFKQNEKILAVYYSLERDTLKNLKKELDKLEGVKTLYCLTLDPLGLGKSDFIGWKDIVLEPIPQKILEVYKQIYEY